MAKQKIKRIPTDKDFRRLLDDLSKDDFGRSRKNKKARNTFLFFLLLAVAAVGAAYYFFPEPFQPVLEVFRK